MTMSRFPFAGSGDATAFLIDPHLIGGDEAIRRVVDGWVAGSRLLEHGSRWLLLPPVPRRVRAEHAPGLPVLERDGRLLVRDSGREIEVDVVALRSVDLLDLLDLDGLQVETMSTVAGQSPHTLPVAEPARLATPLRGRAGVGAADTALARGAARLADDSGRARSPRQERATVASLIARSPVGPAVRRRHARYVDRLTKNFDRQNWDEALRGAISLDGSGGAVTLRLPRRRTGTLRPGPARDGGAAAVPFGGTVQDHLREMYTRAAQQLERDGEHLLAAFVHADLLGQANFAADLLERHGLFVEAAELAEDRDLPPAYAVRLWWRAGDRDRAVRVAVARGAFESALARLGRDDAAAGLDLRRAWVAERRAAGDHLGAVTAAWAEPTLRSEVMEDVAAAVAAGGAVAGQALAHWLEHRPGDEAAELGRRILTSADPDPDPSLQGARASFLSALSTHQVSRPALDRELTSLALEVLLRGDTAVDGAFPEVVARLQERADPVLAADMPRLRAPVWTVDEPLEIDLTIAGSVQIHDAVALGPNSLLVALGELGVRLLTRDGRIRARWEVPTHRLIVADHGTRVLLITDRRPRYSVHQLDLPNGRPLSLPPLDAMPLPTYDGSRPVLVSSRGIEWVEAASDRWRLTWRELHEPGQVVYQVVRSQDSLAALFTEEKINVWQWALPSLALRSRSVVEHAEKMMIVATGEIARLQQRSGVATLDWHASHGHRLTTESLYTSGVLHVLVSGDSFAVLDVTDDRTSLAVHVDRGAPMTARVHLPPGCDVLFRSWNGLIVAGHQRGRLAVFDAVRQQLVANLTLRE